MFFYLSKILWFLLQPSSLMFAALIAAAVLAGTAWRTLSRRLLVGSLAALLVCGLLPVADLLIRPLENRFARPGADFDGASLAGIIVIGGAEDRNGWDREELGGLNEAAERYTEVAMLARRFPSLRVIFAGGSSALVADLPPEAETARRVLEALGVEQGRLALEAASQNTHQNAVFTARLLQPQPAQRWLLVTSAAHMPRAVGCFRAAGFNVVAWPVDYRTTRGGSLLYVNGRVSDGLARFDSVTREYVGLAMYYLTGRTDALLPAP
jgi:uncharacterized SAM-binding protein YcdF (DUF218 family)